MDLTTKTNEIKWLAKGIKNNFLKIGQILIEIRDKELFAPKYTGLREYLDSQAFEFGHTTAYKMIDVYEKYGDHNVGTLSLNKLLQLTKVEDKDVRQEMFDRALNVQSEGLSEADKQPNWDDFTKQLHRTAQRTKGTLEVDYDSKEAKCLRLMTQFIEDLNLFKKYYKSSMCDLTFRIEKIDLMAVNMEDQEVQKMYKLLKEEWKECP